MALASAGWSMLMPRHNRSRLTRLLVVEDERILGRAVQTILEADGYQVTAVVSTVEEAARSLASDPPALVVIDLHLAGGDDGLEVAREAGARRVVPKQAGTDELLLVMEEVVAEPA